MIPRRRTKNTQDTKASGTESKRENIPARYVKVLVLAADGQHRLDNWPFDGLKAELPY